MCYLFNKKLNYIGYGNGYQVRDVLNINDLVKLIFLQTHGFKKFDNNIFNVGGGQSNKISLYNLTRKTNEILKSKKKFIKSKKPGMEIFFILLQIIQRFIINAAGNQKLMF